MEYDLQSEKQCIALDAEKPFVFILDPGAENIMIYDINGNTIENF